MSANNVKLLEALVEGWMHEMIDISHVYDAEVLRHRIDDFIESHV